MLPYESPNSDREVLVFPEKILQNYKPVCCPACRHVLSSTELGGNGHVGVSWQEDVIHSLQDMVRPNNRKVNNRVKDTSVRYCRNKSCSLYMTRF